MSIRTPLLVLTVITLLPCGARGAAITVWEDWDLRGASMVFDRAVPRLGDVGWNDRISSLRIDSGRWEICRDYDYSGCRVVSAEMGAVNRMDSGWNDVVSSLRPVGPASDDSAESIAQRLYRAILGRDADPQGLRNAAAQIERNQTESLVRGMIGSAEYSSLRAQRSAAELVDQMAQGLLGRPADSTERRTHVMQIERGEDAQVVLELLSAGGYSGGGGGGGTVPPPSGPGDYDLDARGAGLVVTGEAGRYSALSSASVALGRDGKARIDFDGASAQTFAGTWSRDSSDLLRLRIPDIGGRRVDATGIVSLDSGRLARVQLTAGTPGAHNQLVYTFVADDYEPPREETLCVQEARKQLEDERDAPLVLLFLAPERTAGSSGRDQLSGDGVVLDDPGSFRYQCEVDSRRGSLLGATVDRR
jgi:hypothetical protein